MVYKANIRPAWVVLVLLMIFVLGFTLIKRSDTTPIVTVQTELVTPTKIDLSKFKNAAENENCLKCHGQSKYTFENPESKKTVTKRMFAELVMDRDVFYVSNHREFKCTDCHSEDYVKFPHD